MEVHDTRDYNGLLIISHICTNGFPLYHHHHHHQQQQQQRQQQPTMTVMPDNI
jgi:hypothetical protein